MSAIVPFNRTIIGMDKIKTGKSVSSRTWMNAADNQNWLLGTGDVLIPSHDPELSIAAGITVTLHYKFSVPSRAKRRRMSFLLLNTGIGGAEITIGSEPVQAVATSASTDTMTPINLYEGTTTTPSTTGLIISIKNKAAVTALKVVGITCIEEPRYVLAIAGGSALVDQGTDKASLTAREPIMPAEHASIGGLFEANSHIVTTGRRRSYLAHARPVDKSTACWSTTSAVNAYIIKLGNILTRKVYASSTTGSTDWYFYCSASDATTSGLITITNVKTTRTDTLTVTRGAFFGSWGWYTISIPESANAFECEDLTTATGMPSSLYSEYNVEFKRSAGAGTFYIASACCEEPP